MTDKLPTAEERLRIAKALKHLPACEHTVEWNAEFQCAWCYNCHAPVWELIRVAEQVARAEGRREIRDKAEKIADAICDCGGTFCLAHKVTNALDEGGGEDG